MDESDLRVRLAAFAFLDERRRLSSDLFERRELQRGFVLEGERVPLQAPHGIFKPRVFFLEKRFGQTAEIPTHYGV